MRTAIRAAAALAAVIGAVLAYLAVLWALSLIAWPGTF